MEPDGERRLIGRGDAGGDGCADCFPEGLPPQRQGGHRLAVHRHPNAAMDRVDPQVGGGQAGQDDHLARRGGTADCALLGGVGLRHLGAVVAVRYRGASVRESAGVGGDSLGAGDLVERVDIARPRIRVAHQGVAGGAVAVLGEQTFQRAVVFGEVEDGLDVDPAEPQQVQALGDRLGNRLLVRPEVSLASRLDADQGAQAQPARAVRLGDHVGVDRRCLVPHHHAGLGPFAVECYGVFVRRQIAVADRFRDARELVRRLRVQAVAQGLVDLVERRRRLRGGIDHGGVVAIALEGVELHVGSWEIRYGFGAPLQAARLPSLDASAGPDADSLRIARLPSSTSINTRSPGPMSPPTRARPTRVSTSRCR